MLFNSLLSGLILISQFIGATVAAPHQAKNLQKRFSQIAGCDGSKMKKVQQSVDDMLSLARTAHDFVNETKYG